MTKMKSIGTIQTLLMLVLLLMMGFTACKSKKKLASVSDTKTEQAEIEDEIEEMEEEETYSRPEDNSTMARLHSYFEAIASAPTLNSANNSISEAATLFSSPDAPVLIIFYSASGQEEFDEPTTISKYLNYLKDQKKSPNKVEDFTLDGAGKIKELVLVRK